MLQVECFNWNFPLKIQKDIKQEYHKQKFGQ